MAKNKFYITTPIYYASGKPHIGHAFTTLYATGLGQVQPPVASGKPAPFNPLARTISQPQIILAGRPCEILYAGFSPGWVGLYQINLRVPSDVPSRKQSLVISQTGNNSPEYRISISGGSTR